MAGHFLVVSVVCGKRSIRARAELRPKMGKKAELTSVQPRTGLISFHFIFHFAWKPALASPNVGCFLRLAFARLLYLSLRTKNEKHFK